MTQTEFEDMAIKNYDETFDCDKEVEKLLDLASQHLSICCDAELVVLGLSCEVYCTKCNKKIILKENE